ncbi:MAG TPA: fimbrial protein [Rhodanobacteraceae bacterium]|jgi:type 1 fimbria pilin|nr:fimbrial protein [Rhodanobacteraceae bacterium]
MHLILSCAASRVRAANARSQRLLRLLCGCLLLVGMASVPRAAWAVCWFTSGSATSVTYNVGTTITLTPSTPIGAILWTSSVATPANTSSLDCNGSTNSGIFNTIAGSPTGSDNKLFPTGIQGISYRLLHPDTSNELAAYPYIPFSGGSGTIGTALQLIYTGPLPPNNSTLTGQLSQWKVDICNNPNLWFGNYYQGCNGTVAARPVETFNISATITINVPTCNVDPGSVNKTVTLPNVTTAQLVANQTPGKTPFSLQLINCPTNQKVFINLNTANAYTGGGASGVIAPTTGAGYAGNVGVQILQADGSTPVTFGDTTAQAINTGTTTGSNYAINLYARYYRTGTPSAGSVKGVATYTINYQ